jgi:hypothetical protein
LSKKAENAGKKVEGLKTKFDSMQENADKATALYNSELNGNANAENLKWMKS